MNPGTDAGGERRCARAVLALLVLAAGVRVALIARGGQFFFPDESRYSVARDAAALLAEGRWRQGIALPFEGGDHAGFKALGIVPAMLERLAGASDALPAVFFAAFSLGSIALVGGIARRLGGSPVAVLAAVGAAAASATLALYSRHLLPYDASMCLALGSLYVALPRPASATRLLVSGVLVGGAFLVYYGYWTLAGACVIAGLAGSAGWRERARRLTLTGMGAAAPLALAIGINRLFGSGELIHRAREFSGTITQGDFRGVATPWEYLWQAERLWLPLTIGFGAYAVLSRLRSRAPGGDPPINGGVLGLALALGIWLVFILAGDLLHKFAIYGRLVRQVTPFLCLAFGFGFAAWSPARRGWKLAMAALLAVNAAVCLGAALVIQFPRTFEKEWLPFIAQKQGPDADPRSYYRFVNVTHFIYEPEILRESPAETVAAARHPFSYAPYLYEGLTPAARALRRAVDHRMRVVRMAVPAAEIPAGTPTGAIAFDVQFADRRGGYSEPLLSVGPFGAGDLYFAQFVTDRSVRFGCEVMGYSVFMSDPVEIDPGLTYRISCFSGPNQVELAFGDRVLIRRVVAVRPALPGQAYLGANPIGAGSAETQFSGRTSHVVRGGSPPPIVESVAGEFGAIRLRIVMARERRGRPEPLFAAGDPGRAVLGYAIPLANGKVTLGVEIWGTGVRESAPLTLVDGPNELVFECGALLPPVGGGGWGSVPPGEQKTRKDRIRIWLNGTKILDEPTATPELGPTSVAIGKNPIGGSYVGAEFSGTVAFSERMPVAPGP